MKPLRTVSRLVALLALLLTAAGAAAQPPVTRGDSLGLRFVRIPAGEFLMGSDEDEQTLAPAFPQLPRARFALLKDEGPVHRVRISRAFWMGQHEVTVGQFRRFIQASGHVPESEADGTGGYGWRADYDPAAVGRSELFEGRDRRYAWHHPGFAQGEDHPVTNVSWHDAQALADWLSRREGVRYRLPTEAEWEYACRAGSRTRYHSGDDPATLRGAANLFDHDSAQHWPALAGQAAPYRDGFAFTAPVGSFAPNAWGLHDMHGNVWEWTADWHGDDYYAHAPPVDPQGPPEGTVRVRRGGSWHTWPFYARCSYRNWSSASSRYTLIGIRLVRELRPGE